MHCITGWILLYFINGQFSDEWVQALYAVPYETDKVFGGRYYDNLIHVILLATCYFLWRLLIACLWRWKGRRALTDHISVVWKFRFKSEKELCFSHGSHSVLIAEICKRGCESQRFMATSCIQIYTSENPVEWKHNREAIFSRWTPSAADESSGSTIFKSFFLCMLKQLTVCWAHCLKPVPIKIIPTCQVMLGSNILLAPASCRKVKWNDWWGFYTGMLTVMWKGFLSHMSEILCLFLELESVC